MESRVILLTSRQLDSCDDNLIKLIEFSGVTCRVITANEFDRPINMLSTLFADRDNCLMINARFLLESFSDRDAFNAFKSLVFSTISFVLVYNVFPDAELNAVIENFSDGAVQSVNRLNSNVNTFRIAADSSDICKQFSGLSFECQNKDIDFTLTMGKAAQRFDTLISINSAPFFVALKLNSSKLYLLASNKVLDLDETANENWNYKEYFSQFIPLTMFIRFVLGNRCWHSTRSFACFIIDDPLLRPRYGFLNYDSLLESVDRGDCHTSIAFIPYNFRRSDKEFVRRLGQRHDRITICIHGCNHTDNEFGTRELLRLCRLAKLATERMLEHEEVTGMSFDNVMVFPKGLFSSHAMEVLKTKGYLAAVNTRPFCVDQSGELKISDLLDVAVMNHSCFPLFVRRYPRDVVDFAFDLFWGKPALIVEHHNYFKSGYGPFSDFVHAIDSLDDNVYWAGLQRIVESSYLERRSSGGTRQIKIYGSSCIINNSSDSFREHVITKRECGKVPIHSVTLDGVDTPYVVEDRMLTISTKIPPLANVELEIKYKDRYPDIADKVTLNEQVRIWLRRRLSEFRDNHISKSEILSSMSNRLPRRKRKPVI